MKTKSEIVQELLEKDQITAEEAVILLMKDIQTNFSQSPIPISPSDKVPYHEICSCNPLNGGSGVCGCVLANELVDPNKTNFTLDSSNTETYIYYNFNPKKTWMS